MCVGYPGSRIIHIIRDAGLSGNGRSHPCDSRVQRRDVPDNPCCVQSFGSAVGDVREPVTFGQFARPQTEALVFRQVRGRVFGAPPEAPRRSDRAAGLDYPGSIAGHARLVQPRRATTPDNPASQMM